MYIWPRFVRITQDLSKLSGCPDILCNVDEIYQYVSMLRDTKMYLQSLYKILYKWLYIFEVILYNLDGLMFDYRKMDDNYWQGYNRIVFTFVGEWLMMLKEYLLKNYLLLFLLSCLLFFYLIVQNVQSLYKIFFIVQYVTQNVQY